MLLITIILFKNWNLIIKILKYSFINIVQQLLDLIKYNFINIQLIEILYIINTEIKLIKIF